jgi:hypothetical protein
MPKKFGFYFTPRGHTTCHHRADATPSEAWTPSECCSRPKCDRPPAASRQRSNAADQGECPLYVKVRLRVAMCGSRHQLTLVLNLLLHILDRVAALHLQRDSLSRQCLNKNLHL